MTKKLIIGMSMVASLALPAAVALLLHLRSFWALRIALDCGPIVLLLVIAGLIQTWRAEMSVGRRTVLIFLQSPGLVSGVGSLWAWCQVLRWGSIG